MSSIQHQEIYPTARDASKILQEKSLTALGAMLGAGGSERITGAGDTAVDKIIFCFVPQADTVIGAQQGNALTMAGKTCYAGIPVYGIWTQLTQASGDATYYFLP